MTQIQRDCAGAAATGGSLRHVGRHGFSLLAPGPGDPDPEEPCLVLDCPFHGGAVPYPGVTGDGTPALAECPRCDVDFDFDPAEVYATSPTGAQGYSGLEPRETCHRRPARTSRPASRPRSLPRPGAVP